ncbi:MAG: chiA1, partial [Chloroflexi bacterium]|nr:chiA1 [Chloroflexota bacterium]
MITPQFRRLSLVLGLISAIGLLCACASSEKLLGSSASPEPTVNIPPRIIGYFTSWGVAARGYPVASIPADKLTHINYAFSAISPLGKCALGDPTADTQRFYSIRDSVDKQADIKDGPHGTFNQLLKLKQKYPHIKVLISLGGWTGSSLFSDVAQTEESRQKFVQSCIELYLQKHAGVFDGVDVDWEYPVSGGARDGKPEDKHNYTLLLEEFRKQLDAQGQADGVQYLLTIAAPAGPQIIANFELDQI